MDLRVDVVRRGTGGTTTEELAMLEAWGKELFAPDQNVIDEFEWHNGQGIGLNIQTYDRDEFVSFANVFTRTIRVDEVEIAMGALNGVMTPRQHQRKGYGTATVREARRVIFEELSADIGFLLCLPKLVKFYEKRGWRVVRCPVWISQTAGPTRWPYKSMVLVNDYGLKQPHSIDLCGPPF